MKAAHTTEVMELFAGEVDHERVIVPDTETSRQAIKDVIGGWRAEAEQSGVDISVGYVTGGYDVAHMNHYWYLMNVRKQVAEAWARKGGLSWETIGDDAKRALISSDVVRLVVGVDGDTILDNRKGNKPKNGSVPRPLYGWETRARDVAAMTFTAPTLSDSNGRFTRPVADLVIAQDPFEYKGTEFADKFAVARNLQPDVWCVYHEQWAETQEVLKTDPNLSCEVLPINEGDYFVNQISGLPFSTSALVKHVKGSLAQ